MFITKSKLLLLALSLQMLCVSSSYGFDPYEAIPDNAFFYELIPQIPFPSTGFFYLPDLGQAAVHNITTTPDGVTFNYTLVQVDNYSGPLTFYNHDDFEIFYPLETLGGVDSPLYQKVFTDQGFTDVWYDKDDIKYRDHTENIPHEFTASADISSWVRADGNILSTHNVYQEFDEINHIWHYIDTSSDRGYYQPVCPESGLSAPQHVNDDNCAILYADNPDVGNKACFSRNICSLADNLSISSVFFMMTGFTYTFVVIPAVPIPPNPAENIAPESAAYDLMKKPDMGGGLFTLPGPFLNGIDKSYKLKLSSLEVIRALIIARTVRFRDDVFNLFQFNFTSVSGSESIVILNIYGREWNFDFAYYQPLWLVLKGCFIALVSVFAYSIILRSRESF